MANNLYYKFYKGNWDDHLRELGWTEEEIQKKNKCEELAKQIKKEELGKSSKTIKRQQ